MIEMTIKNKSVNVDNLHETSRSTRLSSTERNKHEKS